MSGFFCARSPVSLRRAALLLWLAVPGPVPAQMTVQIGVTQLQSLGREGNAVRTRVTPSAGTTALGIPERFDSPGVGLSARDQQTLALTVGRRLSRHFDIEFEAGLPPEIRVRGRGLFTVPTRAGPQFPIDLGEPGFQPLGTARQWSPAVQLRWLPLADCRRFCPALGAGATYSWFTDETLDGDFAQRLNEDYGARLALAAGKPGATTSRGRARPSLRPAFSASASSWLDAHWGLTAAFGYVPFATTAEITIQAADGTRLSRTRDRVEIGALIASLLFAYRF